MCNVVDPYDPSPHPITRANWRNSLGDKQFCKAYKDFFEQELIASGDNWRKRFLDLLLEDKAQPMINGVVCGLLHPLIHIGYALELDSRIVAIEALTQTAVCCTEHEEVINKLKLPKSGTKSALEVLQDIRLDNRFSILDELATGNLGDIIVKLIDPILSHYDQWNINGNNLEEAIEELLDVSVYIYGATHKPDQIEFDFFLLHLLTGMHAIRVTYPHLNDQQTAKNILMQFFFITCVVYIARLRPEINKKLIIDYEVDDAKDNWTYVIQRTVNSDLAEIMHLVKVVHSLRAAEVAYGFKNGFYVKTAVKTVDYVNPDKPWIGASDNLKHLSSLKNTLSCN